MTTALVHFNHSFQGNQTTWPSMRTSSWKPNYGDMLVCAALLRQVELDDTVRVGFPRTLEQPVSRALIRGSTYLHNRFDFEGANQTLDSIDAPLTIVGLGAQNSESDVSFLDQNAGARTSLPASPNGRTRFRCAENLPPPSSSGWAERIFG